MPLAHHFTPCWFKIKFYRNFEEEKNTHDLDLDGETSSLLFYSRSVKNEDTSPSLHLPFSLFTSDHASILNILHQSEWLGIWIFNKVFQASSCNPIVSTWICFSTQILQDPPHLSKNRTPHLSLFPFEYIRLDSLENRIFFTISNLFYVFISYIQQSIKEWYC